MTSAVSLCALISAVIIALIIYKTKKTHDFCLLLMTFVLPFAAGGFHGYTASICALLTGVFLFCLIIKENTIAIYWNIHTVSITVVCLAACVTPLWGADKGMAVFGILRWIPVLLYTVYVTQISPERRSKALELVPLCGVMMTVLAVAFVVIPETKEYVTVNGRLAGFFQYPNTFAAYLLTGFVLHIVRKRKEKWHTVITFILLGGIILSGSRTVFILLLAAVLGILLLQKNNVNIWELFAGFVLALGLGIIVSEFGILSNADRYTGISTNAGTFLVRILYFKDAFRLIIKNPLGLGYMGFQALQGSIQTGRYYVTYVHNGLLQLMLDYGWIPGILMAASFVCSIFSKSIPAGVKLALVLLLGHCMLDYDTEFLCIWFLMISIMDLQKGRVWHISGKTAMALFVPMIAVCLWLGAADLCYYTGNVNACLKITPFHTDAMTYKMTELEDVNQVEQMADRIIAKDPGTSLAWTAKSNAAFLRADVEHAAKYKEQAILCNKYDIREYCDYIDKMYLAAQIYLTEKDRDGFQYCIHKIKEIPNMMQEVSDLTDLLAYKTGDDPSMKLPAEYELLIEKLSAY